MTVLVTGATGLLGPYLIDALSGLGPVAATSRSGPSHPCDLTDADAVASLMQAVNPAVVVHTAALTDVDGCEEDPARAQALNADATAHLADTLEPSAPLVYISTDQVYPDTAGAHREGDESPVNAYGRSKLAGELAARNHRNALVLRTNFFGPSKTPNRQSLSDFVERNLRAENPIVLFDDVLFSPLHIETLAQVVAELVAKNVTGVFNAGCRDGMSKADFGFHIARHLRLPTDNARRGRSSEMPGRAPRPKDLRMDVSRIEAALGRPMPTLSQEVEKL